MKSASFRLYLFAFLIACAFSSTFAQPPSFEPIKNVSNNQIVNNLSGTTLSVVSDGYGQHIVGIYLESGQNKVKHFLIDNDGFEIPEKQYTFTVAAEFPVVTSFSGKLRVTMKVGSEIQIFQSLDGGASWALLGSRNPLTNIFDLDAYSDVLGTHVVWSTAQSSNGSEEIWYVRYGDVLNDFTGLFNVTNLPSPSRG
jgi:hypothetical protein